MGYRLRLAKQDFKFSVAHLTVFADGSAERLHGHNYRVAVELEGEALDEAGLLCDLARVKERVRKACARLDEHVLIPEASAVLEVRTAAEDLELRVAGRSYRLPQRDVIRLPIRNVSIELLARLLFDEFAPELRGSHVLGLAVEVMETDGQSARYSGRIA